MKTKNTKPKRTPPVAPTSTAIVEPPPAPPSTATVVASAPSVDGVIIIEPPVAAPEPRPPPDAAPPPPVPNPPPVPALVLHEGRYYSIAEWKRRAWVERRRPPRTPPKMVELEIGPRPPPGEPVATFTWTSATHVWTYGFALSPPWFFLRRERRKAA